MPDRLGLAVGYRANVWNIGAEGQMYMGGIFATGLAIHVPEGAGGWLLPAMVVAGAIGGALWAAIPAFLRVRFNANEILVSLMLVYVADLLVKYLVFGPWRDPGGHNFPITVQFHDDALFRCCLVAGVAGGHAPQHLAVHHAVAMPLAGCSCSAPSSASSSPSAASRRRAARYAGFSGKRAIWVALLIGGAAPGSPA